MSQGSQEREDESVDNGDIRVDGDGLCSHCNGMNGHHFVGCISISSAVRRGGEVELTEENVEKVCAVLGSKPTIADIEKKIDAGVDVHLNPDGSLEEALPPSGDDIASVDFLWLIAKLAYEVNRVYCVSIGDHSFGSWEDAPEWQRQTNFKGVTMHFENPGATAEDSHVSWLAEKQREGWQYGPVKNAEHRLHPCLVPYNQLPPAQQYKDALFTTICKTMFGSR